MRKFNPKALFGCLASIWVAAAPLAHSAYVYVDTFAYPTQSVSLTFGPGSVFAATNTTAAVGGEREILLSVTNSGFSTYTTVSQSLINGITYDSSGSTRGFARLTYDGADGSSNIDYSGLGDFDLTDGGLNDRFHIRGGAEIANGLFLVTVYSSATDFSQQILSVPSGTGTEGTFTNFFFNFAGMTTFGAGADFSQVNAIVLEMNGLAQDGIDMGLNLFVAIPEPTAWWLACPLVVIGLLRRRVTRKYGTTVS